MFLVYIAFQLCSGFSLDEVSRGYPPVAELEFLSVVASLLRSTSSRVHRLVVVKYGVKLLSSMWVLSSWTRVRTPVPCIGRQILNHGRILGSSLATALILSNKVVFH